LPLKLDRSTSSPEDLLMENSGDLRGAGACANNEEAASVVETIAEMNLRRIIV
jgi:hypothetical protein